MFKEIKKRNIPEILKFFDGKQVTNLEDWKTRREELKTYFQNTVYGFLPPKPEKISFTEKSNEDNFCAKKANLIFTDINVTVNSKDFSFPVYLTLPKEEIKGTFLQINFRDSVPDRYQPTEEIVDNGFAVASFCYKDVTNDDGDFTNGLAGVLYANGQRNYADAGKISMWAWAAMRVMDYLETIERIDNEKVIVIGHSRLGKTALLTAALDNRFYAAVSNDSGCMGAAITRNKIGESLRDIYERFPFWFCKNIEEYIDCPENLPSDQHALISLIAPRKVYIASAELDEWSDTESEYMSAVLVSEVYEKLYNINGLEKIEGKPAVPTSLHSGNVAYHIRKGSHYFSRADWLEFFKYFS